MRYICALTLTRPSFGRAHRRFSPQMQMVTGCMQDTFARATQPVGQATSAAREDRVYCIQCYWLDECAHHAINLKLIRVFLTAIISVKTLLNSCKNSFILNKEWWTGGVISHKNHLPNLGRRLYQKSESQVKL